MDSQKQKELQEVSQNESSESLDNSALPLIPSIEAVNEQKKQVINKISSSDNGESTTTEFDSTDNTQSMTCGYDEDGNWICKL